VDRHAVTVVSATSDRVRRWWLRPEPLARVAVLRTLVYLYVPVDLYIRTAQVVPHAYGSADLYDPVALLRFIHQPSPHPWFAQSLRVVIIAASLIAAAGRFRRVAGWVVAIAYLDWACIAMSYGKVDHDHLALLLALFVLPTVPDAHWTSERRSEAAGWALRWIEIGVVATYFLSAVAKVRFGGWHWVMGATFSWAVVRRGTALADPLLHHPLVLLAAQWGLFCLECSTPVLLFVRHERFRIAGVAGLLSFHVITWLTITINFAPLMVCLAVFLPLEQTSGLAQRLRTPKHRRAEWSVRVMQS
jgi:Vitamin K-dependent gamma-carboxylase